MADAASFPLAEPGYEESARRLFPYRVMTPEAYVARFAHTIGCSAFDLCRYREGELQAWIYRVHELLRDPDEVERCRQAHLTPEERARVRQAEQEPF